MIVDYSRHGHQTDSRYSRYVSNCGSMFFVLDHSIT